MYAQRNGKNVYHNRDNLNETETNIDNSVFCVCTYILPKQSRARSCFHGGVPR